MFRLMATTMPAWVGPTAAIALVVIALGFATMAIVALIVARAAAAEIKQLSDELHQIRAELHPALNAVQQVAETGAELSGRVREEIEGYLHTSRSVRSDLERGVRRVKRRLADLDALYEVVHQEVEETALDVTAKVRTIRRGASVIGRIRRWLVRGRR